MTAFKAPAYPLITVDPYFNVWSMADHLYDDVTRHWTGRRHFMTGVVTFDGEHKRFMGLTYPDNGRFTVGEPDVIPQTDVVVNPLTTIYRFEDDDMTLKVEFMTPLLMDDLKLLSRPVSYISYEVVAKDGKEHQITMYLDASAEMCVDRVDQAVTFGRTDYSITVTSGRTNMLQKYGDDLCIDWGTLHLIAPGCETFVINSDQRKKMFLGWGNGNYTVLEDGLTLMPLEGYPSIACRKTVNDSKMSGFICLGYDDIKSIRYYGENIDAYWKCDGDTFEAVVKKAVDEYAQIKERAEAFDAELMARAGKVSEKYAKMVALAYRQTIGAHKLTCHGGEIQFLSKECFSNGCMATVDVTYPSIPLFLIYNPDLVEGMLNPIFDLCDRGMWPFEFAPHDVGRYPVALRQLYGIGEMYMDEYQKKARYQDMGYAEYELRSFQMPIEECGNMLLCVSALCAARKDDAYAVKHVKLLRQWADYLVKAGFNPDDTLCTDDFAGHLAHNCNLSLKATMALGAWADVEKRIGNAENAAKYRKAAEEFAANWKANGVAGDHTKLTFDSEDSWSLKYNLVWNKLLKLDLFEQEMIDKEVESYKQYIGHYGIPLDGRSSVAKTDWALWSTVLSDNQEYLDDVVDGICNMLAETKDRAPFTDCYWSDKARCKGFRNRTVQGGLFINMLEL